MSIDFRVDIFETEDNKRIRELIQEFAKKEIEPQAASHDEKEEFNTELFKKLKELGLLGATIPNEYGGAGLDTIGLVILYEEMSRYDPAFTLSYLASDLLFGHNLSVNGSDEQKKKYFPGLLSGDIRGGVAMTESGGGTDVLGAMKTKAELKGDYYILNGEKQFITNFDGDAFLVYAKTGTGKYDVSLFIVDSDFEGFGKGKAEKKHGMRASPTGTINFNDCKVPLENLVGKEGEGLTGMMRNLEIERVGLAALSSGIALQCFDIMSDYAINKRESFDKKIVKHQHVGRMLADPYTETMAARLLLYYAASKIHPDQKQALLADAAKLKLTRLGDEVSAYAMRILGGSGYTRECVVERLHRDAHMNHTGGGTNEALMNNIARNLEREMGKK